MSSPGTPVFTAFWPRLPSPSWSDQNKSSFQLPFTVLCAYFSSQKILLTISLTSWELAPGPMGSTEAWCSPIPPLLFVVASVPRIWLAGLHKTLRTTGGGVLDVMHKSWTNTPHPSFSQPHGDYTGTPRGEQECMATKSQAETQWVSPMTAHPWPQMYSCWAPQPTDSQCYHITFLRSTM